MLWNVHRFRANAKDKLQNGNGGISKFLLYERAVLALITISYLEQVLQAHMWCDKAKSV